MSQALVVSMEAQLVKTSVAADLAAAEVADQTFGRVLMRWPTDWYAQELAEAVPTPPEDLTKTGVDMAGELMAKTATQMAQFSTWVGQGMVPHNLAVVWVVLIQALVQAVLELWESADQPFPLLAPARAVAAEAAILAAVVVCGAVVAVEATTFQAAHIPGGIKTALVRSSFRG